MFHIIECACNAEGAVDNNCDVATGHCFCHSNVVGDSCDACVIGTFNFPTCEGNWGCWEHIAFLHSTVFLQRGSCIYGEKSYGMSLWSYYKIFMIFR